MNKNKKIKVLALTLAGISAIGAGSMVASNMKDAKAMRILNGLSTILTGSGTSNGTSFQGIPKSASTIKNTAFKNTTSSKTSASVSTSRRLAGSNGAINSGAVTSNGTSYEGIPRTSSTINNQAFTPGNGIYKAKMVSVTPVSTSTGSGKSGTKVSSVKLQISGSGSSRTITKTN